MRQQAAGELFIAQARIHNLNGQKVRKGANDLPLCDRKWVLERTPANSESSNERLVHPNWMNQAGRVRKSVRERVVFCQRPAESKIDVAMQNRAFCFDSGSVRAVDLNVSKMRLAGCNKGHQSTRGLNGPHDIPFGGCNVQKIVHQTLGESLEVIAAAEIGAAPANSGQGFGAE